MKYMPESKNTNDNILDRIVEKQEFTLEMDKKASKIAIKNCMKSIGLLHEQIMQIVRLIVTK